MKKILALFGITATTFLGCKPNVDNIDTSHIVTLSDQAKGGNVGKANVCVVEVQYDPIREAEIGAVGGVDVHKYYNFCTNKMTLSFWVTKEGKPSFDFQQTPFSALGSDTAELHQARDVYNRSLQSVVMPQ